jgi:homoserine kinase
MECFMVLENQSTKVLPANPASSVLVQVPASTSNCGPGFDTLGVALQLYNFVRIVPVAGAVIEPLEPDHVDPLLQQMVADAAQAYFEATDTESHGFRYALWGEVPVARGLGSSATIRAGIVAGLNALDGSPLTLARCIALVSRLDHAPDNTCAAFAGGFCVARTDPETGAYREHLRFEVPESLAFVAVSPDMEVKTEESRRILPQQLPFNEVAQSLNSLAFLVAAFASGDYERLNGAVNDRIHQPYREVLNPFAREAIAAGCEAGGYSGWLSGSGSTVVCLAPVRRALRVGNAMAEVFKQNGVRSRVHPLATDNHGLTIRFDTIA